MDEQDKAEAAGRITDLLWRQNVKAKRYEGLIERTDRFMAGIPPQERPPLSRAVMELKEALTVDNTEEINRAGDSLVDLMFDMENQE